MREAEKFRHIADVLQAAQRTAIAVENAPDERKRLRSFSVQEAAALLGVSLRELRKSAGLTPPGRGITPRMRLEFPELLKARETIAATAKKPALMPRRRAGEKLATLVFTNFKGGSAKTTSSVHFAQFLALAGYRVLLVDLDSQGSATAQFGLDPSEEVMPAESFAGWVARHEASAGVSARALCRRTYWPSIDILPASTGLAEAEESLASRATRGAVEDTLYFDELGSFLAEVESSYDVAVVDTRPDVNMLMTTALHAATGLVVPTRATMTDLASTGAFFAHLASYVADFAAAFGQELGFSFSRILITAFDPSDRSQEALASLLRERFGDAVLPGAFLHSRIVGTAGFGKETLYEYEPTTDRAAYNRVLASANAVNRAIELEILKHWGRAVPAVEKHA